MERSIERPLYINQIYMNAENPIFFSQQQTYNIRVAIPIKNQLPLSKMYRYLLKIDVEQCGKMAIPRMNKQCVEC